MRRHLATLENKFEGFVFFELLGQSVQAVGAHGVRRLRNIFESA